jgi:cytochrome c biogenesis factor
MTWYVIACILIISLGIVYVKGYDLVKKKSPEHLPHYYLIMATTRILLVLTIIGIHLLLNENKDESIHFALTCLGMYVVMMVATLSLRH